MYHWNLTTESLFNPKLCNIFHMFEVDNENEKFRNIHVFEPVWMTYAQYRRSRMEPLASLTHTCQQY